MRKGWSIKDFMGLRLKPLPPCIILHYLKLFLCYCANCQVPKLSMHDYDDRNTALGSCRIIVRRRRNHEYKLVRRPARKEDYLAAIQYEVHLDMLRKHRKKVTII